MGTLIFQVSEIKSLLDDSINASERRPTYAQLFDDKYSKSDAEPVKQGEWPKSDRVDPTKIPAGLMLVGDQGVYLMSNNAQAKKVEGTDRLPVVYAKGINPDIDSDYYEKKRRIFGGDDGVEFIDAEWLKEGIDNNCKQLVVTLTPKSLKIQFKD